MSTGGAKVTEATLNGFPSSQSADKFQADPYRFLICADKFQTGYDEPLLHTMYVDKPLAGIKAVQTLSRLNRAHPQKHDVFVLDFMNDVDTIQAAFSDYYRTTILSKETDPNKLHDLKADLDGYQVYTQAQVDQLVELYLGGADRDCLDPILDACVTTYTEDLDEDGQVGFKGKAKAFNRMYGFLSAILPYTNAGWEKLSIFLTFLVPKLPAPQEEDLSKGILEAIDMDSYRVEKKAAIKVQLPDQDAEIEPVPTEGGGHKPKPELDRLSNILKTFNEHFGNIPWADKDRILRLITEDIPNKVATDTAYQNAKQNSDPQNARIEHDKALDRVMTEILQDDTDLFKQFSDNESFRRWLTDKVFAITYQTQGIETRAPRNQSGSDRWSLVGHRCRETWDRGTDPIWQRMNRLRSGDAYSGIVRDDTAVFTAAQGHGLTVLRFDVALSPPSFRTIRRKLTAERRHSRYSYGFPDGDGDCNCTTWIERLGLPLLTGAWMNLRPSRALRRRCGADTEYACNGRWK